MFLCCRKIAIVGLHARVFRNSASSMRDVANAACGSARRKYTFR
jgi:hypothetical protein